MALGWPGLQVLCLDAKHRVHDHLKVGGWSWDDRERSATLGPGKQMAAARLGDNGWKSRIYFQTRSDAIHELSQDKRVDAWTDEREVVSGSALLP